MENWRNNFFKGKIFESEKTEIPKFFQVKYHYESIEFSWEEKSRKQRTEIDQKMEKRNNFSLKWIIINHESVNRLKKNWKEILIQIKSETTEL